MAELTERSVVNALLNVPEWYKLGVQLGVPVRILREIELYPIRRQKEEFVIRWLQYDVEASWTKLAKSLLMLNHRRVAMEIKQHYIQGELTITSQDVPDGDDSEISSHLVRENLKMIRSKFTKLTMNVCKRLQEMKLDVKAIRWYLCSVLKPGDCISNSEKLDEIFLSISSHGLWDYTHYSTIEDVILEFGKDDVELDGYVEEYLKDLSGFYLTTKIIDYMKCLNEDKDKGPAFLDSPAKYDTCYCHTLSIKLKVNVLQESLLYIERLWRRISRLFVLPSLTALLDNIIEGSVTIVWRIQAHLLTKIDTKSLTSAVFFHQEGIVEVKIDNQLVYNEKQAMVDYTQQLLKTCADGNPDVEEVKCLIDFGVNLDVADENGRTPLYWASSHGRAEVVELLVKKGAQVNIKDNTDVCNGDSPLIVACWEGHVKVASVLLDNGANVDDQDKYGRTGLSCASQNGYVKIAEMLITNGAQVDLPDEDGATPLLCASQSGEIGTALVLIHHGAKVNQQTTEEIGCYPLTEASAKGHSELVSLLIDNGASVNAHRKDGATPLTLASQEGHSETVKVLISKGADVNLASSKDGDTPLILASHNGHSETVKVLISKGADVNLASSKDGATPLLCASQSGEIGTALVLIHHGAKVNQQTTDEIGGYPLAEASAKGHSELVSLLIENGASVNAHRKDGDTPLILASPYGHSETVKVLISKGADVNLANSKDGGTALFSASQNGHVEVMKILITNGAQVNLLDKDGGTALFYASQNGHVEVMKILITNGAQVNLLDKSGGTALHYASYFGQLHCVEQLVNSGANLNVQDEDGFSPLMDACRQGHTSIVKVLCSKGAHLDLQNKEGRTALAIACWMGNLDMVSELLQAGANTDIQDQEGLTALMLATKKGCFEIVEALLKAKANPNITEKDAGWNTLYFAVREDRIDIVRLLIGYGCSVDFKDNNGVTALDMAKLWARNEIYEELQQYHTTSTPKKELTKDQKVKVQSVNNRLTKVLRFLEKTLLRDRVTKREKIEELRLERETVKTKEPSKRHIEVTFSKTE